MATITIDQIRNILNRLPGRWEVEGDLVLGYGKGSVKNARLLTLVRLEWHHPLDREDGYHVVTVDGRDGHEVKARLVRELGSAAHVITGTVVR